MSTERSFGLNSILPTSYMSKAEAFAKCLQDKLRSLGGGEESNSDQRANGETKSQGNESPRTPYGSLNQFSEQQIADNVFIQGPLSYKRRSIPENSNKQQQNGSLRSKYIGSVVDKRGVSSDSEDSDLEELATSNVHRRVAQLQKEGEKCHRLPSVNSVDSNCSWCSCDEGPDPDHIDDDDDEEVIDTFAAQIKGSPPIHNPRLRNLKRKNRDDKLKIVKVAEPSADSDLFFDFDVECFSPVNLEDESEFSNAFQNAQLRLTDVEQSSWNFDPKDSFDTGQNDYLELQENVNETPSSSPVNIKTQDGELTDESKKKLENDVENDSEELSENNKTWLCDITNQLEQLDDIEPKPELSPENFCEESECIEPICNSFELDLGVKDSGICSCEETSSRIGDDEEPQDQQEDDSNPILDEQENKKTANEENKDEKEIVKSNVMILCEGVLIDESYLPSPRMKLRRCSSLKTWKTPPGTPGRKKIVRFADALGLDLADVRMFLDEVPKIPNSAFEDLHYEIPPAAPPPVTERTLIPMFQQPGTQMDFLQRVRQNNVSLESAILTDVTLLSISGMVRVRNLSFHKTVHVRYSKDSWKSFSDLQATFVPNSSDGFCDNFSFILYGHTLDVGDRLEFAIRYDCGSGQFWDSNGGTNYAFQCMPRSPMPLFPPLGSSPVDSWNKFY